MSRSRIHTPIKGLCAAASEKENKVRAHQAYRSAVRIAVRLGRDIPSEKLYMNPWTFAKDGKAWVSPRYRTARFWNK